MYDCGGDAMYGCSKFEMHDCIEIEMYGCFENEMYDCTKDEMHDCAERAMEYSNVLCWSYFWLIESSGAERWCCGKTVRNAGCWISDKSFEKSGTDDFECWLSSDSKYWCCGGVVVGDKFGWPDNCKMFNFDVCNDDCNWLITKKPKCFEKVFWTIRSTVSFNQVQNSSSVKSNMLMIDMI